tara:strand:+ start:432 stop:2249 length:1818 start_codon:yes stop_codon:yes gene_type:complete
MVKNTAIQLMLLTLLSMISASIFAETQLKASVDRSKIYEMDTLNLTIQGQVDIDFSFGGLMNFGLGQSDSPEIVGLEKDFEILDRQQSYNMQSINGESKAQVLWKYTLAPKNPGVLEIPTAKYKDAETQAIQITVIEGKAPKSASEPPAIFLEVETDKQTAYVQEQIIYTLRLYTQGLVNGELTDPLLSDAIIEPFGEQKKYYRMAFNQRYEVVERQYLIFPQKSGVLTIGEQTFQGVSLKHGRRTRMKDMSEAIELTIKPPASSFSGKNWLPATSLFLNEQWQGDLENLKVGESITRKIELSALGLLGSALPPISMDENSLYKLYIDKPQTESIQHESGVQAKRTDSFAIVAIKDGTISLGEIRIPWWDTVNDVEREAIIPARTIAIAVNPQLPVQANTAKQQIAGLRELSQEKQKNETNNLPENELTNNTDSLQASGAEQNHLWQTAAGILLILWLLTTVYFYKQVAMLKGKLNAIPLPKQASESSEKEKFNAAITSIKHDDKRMTQDVLSWLNTYQTSTGNTDKLNSLQDIKILTPLIYELLTAYEESSYSKSQVTTFDKDKLINCLKGFRENNLASFSLDKNYSSTKQSKLKAQKLEPFYQ